MAKEFAVIRTGGKQYRVTKGDKVRVEKLSNKEGSEVSFKEVLLYVEGKDVEVGSPKVSSAKVVGKVLEHGKGDKVIVYKYKKRKRYSKKQGHRQPYTEVEIIEVSNGGTSKKAPAKKKTTTKKSTAKKTSTKTTTKKK